MSPPPPACPVWQLHRTCAQAKTLGVTLDSPLCLTTHIQSIRKSWSSTFKTCPESHASPLPLPSPGPAHHCRPGPRSPVLALTPSLSSQKQPPEGARGHLSQSPVHRGLLAIASWWPRRGQLFREAGNCSFYVTSPQDLNRGNTFLSYEKLVLKHTYPRVYSSTIPNGQSVGQHVCKHG